MAGITTIEQAFEAVEQDGFNLKDVPENLKDDVMKATVN
ncbi:MAG: DUF4116 domain-containing protein [Fibromonadales bacterium]|nr:DUF4116 domain-containing protein [Fibromonadales bacterium]